MKPPQGWADFLPPARYAYRYRSRVLGFLLDGHVYLREMLRQAWPGAIRRELAVNERIIEVPFALKALDLQAGSRILDVGSRWSLLPLYLSTLGHRVVASDLVPAEVVGAGPDAVVADLRRAPFRDGSFDAATMISTLEHVGIGFYDGRVSGDDDLAVMRELRRILRAGAPLVLTVPFGKGGVGTLQRAYDPDRLRSVSEGWVRGEARFFLRAGSRWSEVSEESASHADSVDDTHAVALLVLRHP